MLKLELSLQQLSLIRIAISIWEDEKLKNDLSKFVDDELLKSRCYQTILVEKSKYWIKQKRENSQSINIPYSMLSELLYVVTAIGNRLFSWLKRIDRTVISSYTYPKMKNYVHHIYWTSIGTIDEIKIFKEIFNGIPENKDNVNMNFLFDEACNYCLEEYIVLLWNEISYVKTKSVENVFKNEQRFITDYWLSFLLNGKRETSIRWEKTCEFRKCLKNDLSIGLSDVKCNIAIKYFYEKIHFYEKKSQVARLNSRQLSINVLWTECEWKSSSAIDCLVFLLQRMSEPMLIVFLEEHKTKVLNYFLKTWPWRYLFLGMLDLSWRFITPNDYHKLIDNIINTIIEENKDEKFEQNYTSLWLISETWTRTPSYLRESIVNLCWTSNKPLLRKLKEITVVVTAINDDNGIYLLRDELFKGFEDSCATLVSQDNTESLNVFLTKILTTDEDRNLFKKKIDTKKVCKNFIMDSQYDAAEKFLNFRFDNVSDKILFKNHWKDDDCGRTIYNIWYKNSNNMKTQLQMFFNWLGITQDEMLTLKNELIHQRDHVIFKEHSLRNCPFFYNEALIACDYYMYSIK